MFLSAIGVLVPAVISAAATYYDFLHFYADELFTLLVLTLISVVFSVLISMHLPRSMRLLTVFSGYTVLWCLLHNLNAAVISVLFLGGIYAFWRRKRKFTRIVFLSAESAMPITFTVRRPHRRALLAVAYLAFIIFGILYALTLNFSNPGFFWGHTAFPIRTNERLMPSDYAIPGGEITCAEIYDSTPLLVDSFYTVQTLSGEISPAEEAGILPGDVITKINSQPAALSDFIIKNSFDTNVEITLMRPDESGTMEEHTVTVTPVYDKADAKYIIGIYFFNVNKISDSFTIQTLSFSFPESGLFASTAHSAEEISLDGTTVLLKEGVATGRDDGALNALAKNTIGQITYLSDYGAFGSLNSAREGKAIPIAPKSCLRRGKAKLLSAFAGGEVIAYDIFIVGTYRVDGRDTMEFFVTDERLKNAGGIARGMSGSPIIQNGMLLGALSNIREGGITGWASFACDMAHEMSFIDSEVK